MYGFKQQETAEREAAALRLRYPENQYEVRPHSVTPSGVPLTWGVVKFVPYTPLMPWRNDGFVWFAGVPE